MAEGVKKGLCRFQVGRLEPALNRLPEDEQSKPAPDHDPGIAGGNTARVYDFDAPRLTTPG